MGTQFFFYCFVPVIKENANPIGEWECPDYLEIEDYQYKDLGISLRGCTENTTKPS